MMVDASLAPFKGVLRRRGDRCFACRSYADTRRRVVGSSHEVGETAGGRWLQLHLLLQLRLRLPGRAAT